MSFIFNAINSDNIGFNITSRQVYNAPEYDVTSVEVPGRSGNVLIPQGRFKNKIVTYTGFMKADSFTGSTKEEKLSKGLSAFKSGLLREPGYQRLTDSYDPGMVRWGFVNGEIEVNEVHDRADGAEVVVSFMCKPFLEKEESEKQTTGSAVTVTNPYYFDGIVDITINTTTGSTPATMTITNQENSVARTWTLNRTSNQVFHFVVDDLEWVAANGTTLINNLVTPPTDLLTPFPTLITDGFENNVFKFTFTNITRAYINIRWRTL